MPDDERQIELKRDRRSKRSQVEAEEDVDMLPASSSKRKSSPNLPSNPSSRKKTRSSMSQHADKSEIDSSAAASSTKRVCPKRPLSPSLADEYQLDSARKKSKRQAESDSDEDAEAYEPSDDEAINKADSETSGDDSSEPDAFDESEMLSSNSKKVDSTRKSKKPAVKSAPAKAVKPSKGKKRQRKSVPYSEPPTGVKYEVEWYEYSPSGGHYFKTVDEWTQFAEECDAECNAKHAGSGVSKLLWEQYVKLASPADGRPRVFSITPPKLLAEWRYYRWHPWRPGMGKKKGAKGPGLPKSISTIFLDEMILWASQSTILTSKLELKKPIWDRIHDDLTEWKDRKNQVVVCYEQKRSQRAFAEAFGLLGPPD